MSTPLPATTAPQPTPATPAAAAAGTAIPRSAQRDAGNSKLGTFGVRHPTFYNAHQTLTIPRSNQAWLKCSR